MINLSLKKTCIGCRAFVEDGIRSTCELGYSLNIAEPIPGMCLIAPAEPCPKPRTYADYFDASKNYRKHNRYNKAGA